MNFNQLNKVLEENKISIDDVMRIANKFEKKDLTKEDELRNIIHDLSGLVGKDISIEEENKMIDLVKKGSIK